MRFPDEHGERNHYDCGDTYDSNFPSEDLGEPEPTRETDPTRQATCICDSGFGMNLSCLIHSPVPETYDSNTAQPLPQTEPPFTASEFQERIKRQLFGSASVGSESPNQTTQTIPDSLGEWLDDKRSREAAAWDEEQSREHEQRQLQEETDNQ
jgi:hypothetical protein